MTELKPDGTPYKTSKSQRESIARYKARVRARKAEEQAKAKAAAALVAAQEAAKAASLKPPKAPAKTAAERKRAQRQRERLSLDPVRAFLSGVLAERDAAVAAELDAPWHHTAAIKAQELLSKLDTEPQTAVDLTRLYFVTGCRTEDERADLRTLHERAWARVVRARERTTGRARQSAVVEEALSVVIYAEQQRANGKATSPTTTAGLGAAAKVLAQRSAEAGDVAYQEWTRSKAEWAYLEWLQLAPMSTEDEGAYIDPEALYED